MYRCGHCEDLHFASAQAKRCFDLGDVDLPTVDPGRRRLPWKVKYEWRRSHEHTEAERRLWTELESRIPRDHFFVEWWLDEVDHRVDCLIESARLAIEVDGPSHLGREAQDRRRSQRIRAEGYQIARATNEDVLERGDAIAVQIAERVRSAVQEASRRPTDRVA
jgi:very-short-patch-repair endonuclease